MSDEKHKNQNNSPKQQEPKQREHIRPEKGSYIGEGKAQQEGLNKASEIRPRPGKPKDVK